MRIVLCALALLLSSLSAVAQPTPGVRPLSATPTVDEVLAALEARGQILNDFTADVTLADSDPVTQRESSRAGKVYFQRKQNGDARIRVSFETYKASGNATKQRQDWLLADGLLIDQNFQTKLQVTRQVLKPGQKLNPLKLGDGPFPLPIGQPPADVKQMFGVKLQPPTKDDPADTVHVELTPKPGTRFARKFETIDVWVNRTDGFTPRIETTDKGGATVHTTNLGNVKINSNLTDADFKLAEPGKDWGVRNEELGE